MIQHETLDVRAERSADMARKVRLAFGVEPEVADEVKRLADGIGMSVSQLLGTLLTIAINTTGRTFDTFGAQLVELKGDDAKKS